MRARALAGLAILALVLLATPSSAAPERSVTLTPAQSTASWKSDFRVGPYFGTSVGCDRDGLGCETTLIRLTRAGTLSIATTQGQPTDAVGGKLILDLFRSDAKGAVGKRVAAKEGRSGATTGLSARSLTAGYYVLEVKWFDLTVGDYTGTATYSPK